LGLRNPNKKKALPKLVLLFSDGSNKKGLLQKLLAAETLVVERADLTPQRDAQAPHASRCSFDGSVRPTDKKVLASGNLFFSFFPFHYTNTVPRIRAPATGVYTPCRQATRLCAIATSNAGSTAMFF